MSEVTSESLTFPGRSRDVLSELLQEGAQRMLGCAIEAEVAEWIESHAHVTDGAGRRQIVRNGYLPETITNFVALLGWNPGMKTDDGKDLEKFDMPFIAKHFGIERIGKTNSKFDRNKLLSFSADAIGAMTDSAFVNRWLSWLAEYEPAAHNRVAALGTERQLLLARALRPRAKTFRDALRPIGFLLSGDNEYTFEAAAVDKSLRASNNAGLALLRTCLLYTSDAADE